MNTYSKLLSVATLGWFAALGAGAETVAPTTGDGIVQLSELEGLSNITYLSGEAVNANLSTKGNPIIIEGTTYESGVGTHAPSVCIVKLNGATSFHTVLGVDDGADQKADHGIVDYEVSLYGESITDITTVATGNLNRQNDSYSAVVDIPDLAGYTYLKLEFKQGAQAWADHCDWADARFTYSGEKPVIVSASEMFPDAIVKLPTSDDPRVEIIPLSSLDLSLCTNGWGSIQPDRSIDGNNLTMKGIIYESGVGMHASAQAVVKLNGAVTSFHAVVGIDDEAGLDNGNGGIVDYSVYIVKNSGAEVSVSHGTIRRDDAMAVNVDVESFAADDKYLVLNFDAGASNSNDHVDVANAYFTYVEQNSTRPEMVSPTVLDLSLVGAQTVFSQPGVKFMHKLRCSNPDAVISVSGLPAGLTFNEDRYLVEGIIDAEGSYSYTVSISLPETDNRKEYPISLTVSSNLTQPVPFMGWLSWNVVQGEISNSVIETVADAFVSQGLLDAGYNYLVIDDLWHANSRESGTNKPVEDPAKFPKGMKAAADYVHSKGLKFGIYSDAGSLTCAGKFGSYGYETIDAQQYAEWGVDALKYDFCFTNGDDVTTCKNLYKDMGDALKATGRDILFYICEWGVREPWKWGAEVGGTCWRATYDTRDCWQGANGGIGILESIAGMKDIWPYNGVNRFNDADMMCVGIHGTGKSSSDLCLKVGMTMDEYRTQFALWCMWSSPLTLSFDLRKEITDEDKALMTNPELIALNQDRMGQAAELIFHDPNTFLVLAKDLENGDVAVSVTNLSGSSAAYNIDFADIPALDRNLAYNVRDCVNRRSLDPVSDGTIATGSIPSHATVVYRLSEQGTDGISEIGASEALDSMKVSANGLTVSASLPGTEGVSKRLLLSDVEGRVVSAVTTDASGATLSAPSAGIYIVNAICAGRSVSSKISI